MQVPRTIQTGLMSLVLLGLIGAILVILTIRPLYGADFYYVFYPSAQNLLNGDAILYVVNTGGYYNPAHLMFYWMLLALLPLPLANALHILITFSLLLFVARLWSNYVGWSTIKVLLAITGLYTVDHLIRGQVDVLALFGLILAFDGAKRHSPYVLGLGATIAMIKVANILLPMLLIAWSLRHWKLNEVLKASVIPIVTIILTLLVFGFDWAVRLINKLSGAIPYDPLSSLSTWQLVDTANLPSIVPIIITLVLLIGVAKYRDLTAQNIAFAIIANFLISNYVAGYHYVALIPAILCIRKRWLVFVCWLLALLPLVRVISNDLAWLMILLPVFVGLVLTWQMSHPTQESNPPQD